jgi:hypothetical protein
MTAANLAPSPGRARRSTMAKGDIYRLCRMLHAYLSAFAFIALIFFSATGVLLNHPDWLAQKAASRDLALTLPPAELRQALDAAQPGPALAAAVRKRAPVVGVYKDGDIADGEANLRLEGAKGATSLVIDTRTGHVEATVEQAPPLSIIQDLHRGKNVGPAWSLIIDAAGVLVLSLSLIGYILFFSLRFRLRTSLILTAISLALLAGVFVAFVP